MRNPWKGRGESDDQRRTAEERLARQRADPELQRVVRELEQTAAFKAQIARLAPHRTDDQIERIVWNLAEAWRATFRERWRDNGARH